MKWDDFITATERRALKLRSEGKSPVEAFKVFLKHLPYDYVRTISLKSLTKRAMYFFRVCDAKDQEGLQRWRDSWDNDCRKGLEAGGFISEGTRSFKTIDMSGVEAEEEAELAKVTTQALEARYKKSLELNDRVDCLVTIGTAQFIMQEAVTTMAKRKMRLAEEGEVNPFDDKKLPFSKLILDAIRLANEMLIPFQNREIEKVDTALPMIQQLLGIKKELNINPDDYTAETPPGAIAYQQGKGNGNT